MKVADTEHDMQFHLCLLTPHNYNVSLDLLYTKLKQSVIRHPHSRMAYEWHQFGGAPIAHLVTLDLGRL